LIAKKGREAGEERETVRESLEIIQDMTRTLELLSCWR